MTIHTKSNTSSQTSNGPIKIRAVVSTDGVYLPLSVIETMQCLTDGDDEGALIDKLKDDVVIKVVTFTGRTFEISMQYMKNRMSTDSSITSKKLWIDIAEQWIDIINANGRKVS